MALVHIQYDFFEEKPDELAVCRIQINAMDESLHKVRKKLFAENGLLKKRILELEERMEIIERNLCKK